MSYFISLSLKYMKRNKTRTLYSVFGIILTFILCYVTMSIGYAAWDYSFDSVYLSDPYEVCSAGWICEEEDESVRFSPIAKVPNIKETVDKLSKDKRIDKIVVLKWNYKWTTDAKEIEISDLKKTDVITLKIKLSNTNNLLDTAEKLRDDYGIDLKVMSYVLMYYGQGDSTSTLFLNCVLILIASIFGILSAYILRNTMMIAVTERVRDYGVFRCVGMSDGQHRMLLFTEGIVMSIFASALGMGFGFWLLKLIEPWFIKSLGLASFFSFRFYPKAAVYTAVLCIAVTLFSMFEPARLCAQVSPLEALHGVLAKELTVGRAVMLLAGKLTGGDKKKRKSRKSLAEQSEKDATQCNDISLRFFVNLVPFKLLFIAGKSLL